MAHKLLGKDFLPHDVVAKVTGEAKYAEDFRAEGMVFARLLSSPYPHARVKSIDVSEALKIPGVVGVLVGLPAEKIRVQFGEGAGTYGHSCYDDVALAAALLSQLAGSPVRVQFMRADEHGWDTYGPPHVGEARLACDANGRLVAYEYHGWQHNWSLVETTSQLAGAAPATEWPPVAVQGVNALVCGGMYSIPSVKLVNHRLPGLQYLRGAWLRSLHRYSADLAVVAIAAPDAPGDSVAGCIFQVTPTASSSDAAVASGHNQRSVPRGGAAGACSGRAAMRAAMPGHRS